MSAGADRCDDSGLTGRHRLLPHCPHSSSIEHMFDKLLPPVFASPQDMIDYLAEDPPAGTAEPVPWSEYLPDGLLADLLALSAETDPEHRGLESLERIGRRERVIAWARTQQLQEMISFMDRAEARHAALTSAAAAVLRERPAARLACAAGWGSGTGRPHQGRDADHDRPCWATTRRRAPPAL